MERRRRGSRGSGGGAPEQRQEPRPLRPPPAQDPPGRGAFFQRPRGAPNHRGPHLHHDEPKVDRRGGGPSGRILLPGLQPDPRRPSSPQRRGGGGGGGGGGARQGPPQHQGRPYQRIGVAFLEQLLQKEPSEVAITLASSPGLEEALSQTALRPPFLQLLCRTLRRACSSRTDRHSIQRLLGLVKDSPFLRVCLPQYVAGMLTEAVPAVRHQYPQHIADIVALVRELASVFPASSIQSVAMLMSILPASVNALRASGVSFPEEAERELERVQAYVQHLQERRREGTLRMDSQIRMGAAPEGQGDYRAMAIFPTYEELHREETPFLRPNTLAQPYESPGTYLETHFRLLREDFVRPMREGIVQLLRCAEQRGMRQRRFDDIRVYFNARILAPACSVSGIEYKVQFDTKPLRSVRWENSKRLLYGSLVCLSKDGFETFLFATVAHRESQDLRKGLVHLSFVEGSRPLLAEARPYDSFLMVETVAYFEAYHHILRGLQELREEGLPFQRYIVHCEAEVAAPGYLRGSSSIYDLRCLVGKLPPAATEPEKKEEEEEDHKQGDISAVNILNLQQWPGKVALGLDESQREALHLALTKELAIIQGPPGTGKTYVGLKIVQALLANSAGWGKSPILVVCYTNHALDQFLEGIHAFKKEGIVRVGGRSNSESLKQFTLRELRSRGQFRKHLPHHLRMAHFSVSSQMREAQEQLTKEAAVLECGLRGVLHERHLRSCIADHHWKSLAAGWNEDWMNPKGSFILEWLGLGATPFAHSAPDLEGAEAPGAPEEEEEEDPEGDLLAIPEEAALIQEERLLDIDQPQRRPRSSRVGAELEKLFMAFRLEEEGEWQIQPGQKKKIKQRVKAELQKQDRMTEAEAQDVWDVWRLNWGSRWRLYRHWVHKYQTEIRRSILRHEESYQRAADRLAELRLQEDLWVLKQAQIVGMTTTGAARYRQVLQEVAPRVVVVEEAAEVLEAHTITTLSSSCQHLILIGDHQQLRPSVNVYDLAKNFHLEVSLFERLVKAGLPFVQLNFQHRMRPEIARLLTPHIYQELQNHPSVLQYENIKGIMSNIFFVEHNFPEQEIEEGRSHQNPHEAHFLVALCKYLLCQGYQASQITILTTYTGQLFSLHRLLPAKTFEGVKVHVVDKYQGEENDIVLLSLVRSNPEGRVGFLQASNRICVALSRARKGLFCIGNLSMLSQVPLWSKILHTLREKGHAGHALVLSCQNHPETRTEVARAADFDEVPEGGCSRPCEARLSCGHVCTRACHPYDPLHQEFRCMKPCQKVLCQDGHRCPGMCFQPCGKCKVKVPKILPQCGHQQQVPCSTAPEEFCCQEPCERVLKCGHKCKLTCGQECARRCPEKVPVTLTCGHSQEVECSVAAEVREGRPVPCRTKCPSILECGHPCSGSCHSCFAGRFHESCKSTCTRLLICSHKCQQPCTSNCPPCQRPCQNRCVHSRCQKTCGEPCPPCVEPCEWRCQHYQCSRLCSEPCDRPRCEVPCPEQLPCGHPCAGVCGEPCPQKCLVCNQEELTQIFFGFEDEPGARFVQLEDCGHVFETQGLDCYMDNAGEEEAEGQSIAVKLKVCPACQTPIRKNLRYGALVKKSLAEVELVKSKIHGCPKVIASGAQRLKMALAEKDVLRNYMPEEYKWLLEQLEGPPALSIQHLGYLENLLGFHAQLAELTKVAKKGDSREWEGAKRRLAEVARWLRRPRITFTDQELSELQRELLRLSYLVELLGRCQAARGRMDDSTTGMVSTLRRILEGPGKFTLDDERLVKDEMEALKAVLPTSGLSISEAEKRQILAAFQGKSRGHWFKCPNGHVYLITECGGAMERSCCPDCKASIGGSNHRLEGDNQLAPEMDGATHAAWSNEANMAGRLNWLN